MNNLSNSKKPLVIGALIGSIITIAAYSFLGTTSGNKKDSATSENKPLYWVAPMDANYRRDKPGKSPMGMDLIPVYEQGSSGTDMGPGTISISPDVENNLGVRTVTAKRTALISEIKTVGYVQYDEDRLVHIHPRVEGWVEKLYVKAAGDPVKKDQPLYEIYSPELVNAQEELILAIDRKNQRLIRAAEDRLKALQIPAGAIKQLKKTKKVSQTITFFAPQSGVIDNLNIREGFFVKPGTTLMSIGALDQVWVEAEVFERQAFQVSEGIPVTMTLDFLPGKTWQGKVDYVYPTLDSKTRTLKVRLRFENINDELKPNMFAQVVIHAKTQQDTLLIPKEALIRTGNMDRVVLALGDGRFKSIAVKVGRFDENNTEILSGLNEGELIVSSAQFLLDSESSKDSDFKRMNHQSDTDNNDDNSAKVDGVINSIMVDHRMVNISREAIPKWNRGAATLDFILADNIDITSLSKGMSVNFTFVIDQGNFVITNIHPLAAGNTASQPSH